MPRRRPGPYSRVNVVDGKIDQRTRAARIANETRKRLVEHVGGSPSAVEAMLIERVVQLTVQLDALQLKIAEKNGITDHDSNQYLAWNNSLTRALQVLGRKPAVKRMPTPAEYKAARAAAA